MTAEPGVVVIVADRLIDGTGADPVVAAAVVCEQGRITACGARASLSIPRGARVLEEDDLTLLPGLMDMHVHLGMQAGMHLGRLLMTPQSLSLLWSVPNARATLDAGVTTVRDAGGTPAGVRMAIEQGLFAGPRTEVAVAILGQTGGHADPWCPCGSELPLGAAGLPDIPHGVADGPHEMRRKVRQVLRAGADWIKLCTSGGVLSSGDEPEAAQLTIEEITVAVEEAAAAGRRCMAHAMSPLGIRNAVRAGVATIEHGHLLDEEGAALMVERGTWLVPTIVAVADVIARADEYNLPGTMLAKAVRMREAQTGTFRLALDRGVNIAMGTDSGVGDHGGNARELPLMVAAGMSPLDAIVAATRNSARLLGIDGHRGTLQAGLAADVIAVRGDPLSDIALFDAVENVRLVLKDGAVVCDRRG